MPIRLPTAKEAIIAITVLFTLVCLGVIASINGGTVFCDFMDKSALWEAEGIQCPGFSPYPPTTVYQCSEVPSTSFDEWLNETTYYGPEYCSATLEIAASPTPELNSGEDGASDSPEAPPLEEPTESVAGEIPKIINSECVSKTQLMIVFEFENPVQGEYELFVNGAPYQITPVGGRPERLFFFGAAPPGGGKPIIRLQSLPNHDLVLEEADYSVKQCDFQSPNNNNPGGGGDYVPPPPDPGE